MALFLVHFRDSRLDVSEPVGDQGFLYVKMRGASQFNERESFSASDNAIGYGAVYDQIVLEDIFSRLSMPFPCKFLMGSTSLVFSVPE